MRTAVTTRAIPVSYPGMSVSTLPAGTPVIVTGHDGTGADRTYMVETEVGEGNEAVGADALDFEADF